MGTGSSFASATRTADSQTGFAGFPGAARHLSGGRALPGPVRTSAEQAYGTSFANVRVHDDAAARSSASAMGALGWTWGEHVTLGAGARSDTLGHELAHVAQQKGASQTSAPGEHRREALERDADDAVRTRTPPRMRAPARMVQMQTPDDHRAHPAPAQSAAPTQSAAPAQPAAPAAVTPAAAAQQPQTPVPPAASQAQQPAPAQQPAAVQQPAAQQPVPANSADNRPGQPRQVVGWQGVIGAGGQGGLHVGLATGRLASTPVDFTAQILSLAANYVAHPENASGREYQALVQLGYNPVTSTWTVLGGGQLTGVRMRGNWQLGAFAQGLLGTATTTGGTGPRGTAFTAQPSGGVSAMYNFPGAAGLSIGPQVTAGFTFTPGQESTFDLTAALVIQYGRSFHRRQPQAAEH